MEKLRGLLQEHYDLPNVWLQPILQGVLNHNFIVETPDSTYVLKSYATRLYQPDTIHRVYEMQERVRVAGVPVPRVMRNVEGQPVTVTADGFYLLSEYVAGHHHLRMQIPAAAARSMGRILGQVHDALGEVERETAYQVPELANVVERLERLLQAAEQHRSESQVDEAAYHMLRGKLAALERMHDLPARLVGLTAQWAHGDYHDANLIFDRDDRVAAVLDFDNLRRRPRGYELMRSMRICFYDGAKLMPEAFDFFAGYVEGRRAISEAEVALYVPLSNYLTLARDWPIGIRYENPQAYDPRWDKFIVPDTDWWERHGDAVTERFLKIVVGQYTHQGIR